MLFCNVNGYSRGSTNGGAKLVDAIVNSPCQGVSPHSLPMYVSYHLCPLVGCRVFHHRLGSTFRTISGIHMPHHLKRAGVEIYKQSISLDTSVGLGWLAVK